MFLVADKESSEFVEEKGYSSICLHSKWRDPNTELNQLREMIFNYQVKILFIDSYFVTKSYLAEVGKYTKVVYMDDLNSFYYPVFAVINYGINYKKFHYKQT